MYTAWTTKLPGTWVPAVHANCRHNEIAALLTRSLGPTPGSVPSARRPVELAFKKIRRVSRRWGGVTWDLKQTALSYTGALRARYLEAERSLYLDGPVSSGDAKLRAFLKAEKRTVDKLAKPRMIFPRTPRFNLALASRLKPFEHWLWGNLKSVGTRGVAKTRVVAKGLSLRRRANLIRRKMRGVGDCVVFEVDGKAFEAHCEEWQLVLEHSVYAAAFPGDRELMRMLSMQLRNSGVTATGVKFSRRGGRASGDFNTGMGNSLIMLSIIDAVLCSSGLARYDTLVDGDNALVFLPSADAPRVVRDFARVALELSGHEMTLENPVGLLESVRFGQSAPVETQEGWTMVRDWRKVLSQGTSSHAHLRETRFIKPFLHGVALCELSLARGVPILGSWAESLRQATETQRRINWDLYPDYQVLGVSPSQAQQATFIAPTWGARESFARAFGVTPDEQLEIERRLFAEPPTFVEWGSPLWFTVGFDNFHELDPVQ